MAYTAIHLLVPLGGRLRRHLTLTTSTPLVLSHFCGCVTRHLLPLPFYLVKHVREYTLL